MLRRLASDTVRKEAGVHFACPRMPLSKMSQLSLSRVTSNVQEQVYYGAQHPDTAEVYPCCMTAKLFGRKQGDDESEVADETNGLEDIKSDRQPQAELRMIRLNCSPCSCT
jgi:hypothetical protein